MYNQGLWPVLEDFYTSPTESLFTETYKTPLLLRRNKLALQYYTKFHAQTTQHVTVFQPQHKKLFKQKKTALESFGICIVNNINELQINTTLIYESMISELPPRLLTPIPS